jgi:hypothetical protein
LLARRRNLSIVQASCPYLLRRLDPSPVWARVECKGEREREREKEREREEERERSLLTINK